MSIFLVVTDTRKGPDPKLWWWADHLPTPEARITYHHHSHGFTICTGSKDVLHRSDSPEPQFSLTKVANVSNNWINLRSYPGLLRDFCMTIYYKKKRLLSLSKYDRMFKTYIPDHYRPIKNVFLPIHYKQSMSCEKCFFSEVLRSCSICWLSKSFRRCLYSQARRACQRTNCAGIRNKIWHRFDTLPLKQNGMIVWWFAWIIFWERRFWARTDSVLQGRICLQSVTIL